MLSSPLSSDVYKRQVAANLNFELLPVQDARLTQTLEESQLVWLLQNGAEAVISVSNRCV